VVYRAGLAFACLMLAGLAAAPAGAQVYGYPPEAPPYFDGDGYRGRHVVYDQEGRALVVNRRGRPLYYLNEDGYPARPDGRQRYVDVAPGPYDDAAPAPRPYVSDPNAGRPGADDSVALPGRQAAVPPYAQPDGTPPVQSDAQPLVRESALPPADANPPAGPAKELPPEFRRTEVEYTGKEAAGTIIVDTRHTYLYLVLGHGRAMRYGIGVGREGFTWSGREKVSRMAEWPDWYPPEDMIHRQPYLPRMMAGGPGNPLGARALYLGNTLYRIHGTNDPSTIGKYVSSGCIRLTNEDVEDLYQRVHVGTHVVVLPGGKPHEASTSRHATRHH
jgi:lipoprotein-anchoring transpeptidase ErfK/SrfK